MFTIVNREEMAGGTVILNEIEADKAGTVKIADFGIATVDDAEQTRTGVITASVAYGAPEVLDGKRIRGAHARGLRFALDDVTTTDRPGFTDVAPFISVVKVDLQAVGLKVTFEGEQAPAEATTPPPSVGCDPPPWRRRPGCAGGAGRCRWRGGRWR